jgi:hypothetical protein
MSHKSSRLSFLRRYTDLAPLLYLLEKRVITLLNPRLWDDRNDAYFLELYRQKKCLECVLALCFTEASETYHHWRVFAGGSSGVCLEFDKTLLLTSLDGVPGLRTGSVQYLTINALEKAAAKSPDLPFVKRYPYRDEREFRLIYEDSKGATAPKDVPFDPTALRKVVINPVINPWMANSVYESVKVVLRGIEGWDHLRVQRTTLVDNERWRQLGKRGEPSNQALPPTGRTSKKVTSKRRSKAPRG